MDIVGQKSTAPVPETTAASARPVTKFKRLLGNWGPVALLTLGSLWLIQGALARTANHGVFVQGADYDAGAVKAGSIVSHSIRLVNLSTRPVYVDAQSGCGYTIVDIPSQTLLPLHDEDVKVEVDTGGMSRGTQKRWIEFTMQSDQNIWKRLAVVNFRLPLNTQL